MSSIFAEPRSSGAGPFALIIARICRSVGNFLLLHLAPEGSAANYHIALDSGVIGIETCAKIMESLV